MNTGVLIPRSRAKTTAPAVASPHPIATEAGLALLEQGASAAEAAVAVAAVLGVVWPHMTGLGGDAFFMTYDSSGVRALNASGFSGEAFCLPVSEIPDRGPGSVITVPGAVAGWRALLGERSISRRLLEPAIRLAEDGAPIGNSVRRWMRPDLEPFWRDVMGNGDGETFRQPELAATLTALAEGEDFYTGWIADAMVETCREWGVPLTAEDFAFQRADWVAPCQTRFCEMTVWTPPPNSQGYVTLRLLEAAARCWDAPDYQDRMVAATREVIAERNASLSDPAFVGGDTVAFSILDENGGGISGIQSIYFDWGSGMCCPRTGIQMQNRGVSFSINPQHPNALAPRKRPAHTLAPLLVTDGEKLALLGGTQGGDGQPQTLCQVLTRILANGESAQSAVAAPRWLWGRTWGDANEELHLETDDSDHDRFGHCNLIDVRSGTPVAVTDWRAG